jgi:hypothetical protein
MKDYYINYIVSKCYAIFSLQGTLSKRTKPTLQSNFAKEPFRPFSGLRDITYLINRLIEDKNRQCLTANKSHRLWFGTGNQNVSCFFVSFQTKLRAMQRLRLLLAKRCMQAEKTTVH